MKDSSVDPKVVPTGWHYGGPAIFLHWVLALLVVGMAGLGWYMMSVEDEPSSPWYFDLHKSLGLVIFGLVILRVLWRLTHSPAELPGSLPKWEVKAASFAQWLLYACMILLPVTGFLGASYSKSGVVFFGLHLPAWQMPDHDMAEQFFSVHTVLVWLLIGLVALHVAAAFKHLVIDKDNVFQRMWL